MSVCLCVFIPLSAVVIKLFLLSLSDPLEVRTSASAEWSGSQKGMNAHTHIDPASFCLFICRVRPRVSVFVRPRSR